MYGFDANSDKANSWYDVSTMTELLNSSASTAIELGTPFWLRDASYPSFDTLENATQFIAQNRGLTWRLPMKIEGAMTAQFEPDQGYTGTLTLSTSGLSGTVPRYRYATWEEGVVLGEPSKEYGRGHGIQLTAFVADEYDSHISGGTSHIWVPDLSSPEDSCPEMDILIPDRRGAAGEKTTEERIHKALGDLTLSSESLGDEAEQEARLVFDAATLAFSRSSAFLIGILRSRNPVPYSRPFTGAY